MADAAPELEQTPTSAPEDDGRFKGGFKPRNRSRIYENLYLAGGSVNPGPGVPMVLMSGVTAADAICEDFGILDARTSEEPECPEPVLAV